jgi:metal-responsive CopG/Arc/MetJ family transcriptional regulator
MAVELEEVMREEKRGKSELVREALRRYMEDVRWRKIYRYGELKAQETGISEADVVDIVHERRREKERV